jgi:hypothetical protein
LAKRTTQQPWARLATRRRPREDGVGQRSVGMAIRRVRRHPAGLRHRQQRLIFVQNLNVVVHLIFVHAASGAAAPDAA